MAADQVFNQAGEKLVQAETISSRLFDLNRDPHELRDLMEVETARQGHPLEASLDGFIAKAVERRPDNWTRAQVALDDRLLRQRLRSLGYLSDSAQD